MKLSKTYIGMIDKYMNEVGIGFLLDINGMAVAVNSISLIVFTPYGDDEQISTSDFTGIKVGESPYFEEKIWENIVAPYWNDRTVAYKPMPTTLYLDEIKADVDDVHKELGIPVRTKLYDDEVRNGSYKDDIALKYGGEDGIWLNPELLYDVAKLISSKGKPVDIWIPNNKRQPAVVVGENKYGRHLGFVLGVMKNFKEN